jgi:hypothetical protein
MAVKKGAKKTVGKARRGDTTRAVMKLEYVRKTNGVLAPRYERVPNEEPAPAAEPSS